jgi:hypothetical protein
MTIQTNDDERRQAIERPIWTMMIGILMRMMMMVMVDICDGRSGGWLCGYRPKLWKCILISEKNIVTIYVGEVTESTQGDTILEQSMGTSFTRDNNIFKYVGI